MAKHPVVVVSDLDHTMVQNEDGSHQRLLAFNHVWTTHFRSPENLLVFSTGRSPTLFKKLWQEAPLLTPDVLICSVGSEIFYNTRSKVASLLAGSGQHQTSSEATPEGPGWSHFAPDPSWETVLDQGWDRSKVVSLVDQQFPQLVMQVASEQRPHKVSYTLRPSGASEGINSEEVVERLRQQLAQEGLQAKVIYSGGQDLDILSGQAGKGCGLDFLLQQLRQAGYDATKVQVNGDSGNDSELFEVPGVVGCVVANAHPELRQYAQAAAAQGSKHIHQARNPCAGGIIETMLHFGLLPSTSPVLATYQQLLQLPVATHKQAGLAPATQPHAVPAVHGLAHPSAIPASAEPCAPFGSHISGGTPDVPESSPAIDTAAQLAGSPTSSDVAQGEAAAQQLSITGDTCYQQTSAGLPEQLLETSTCEVSRAEQGTKGKGDESVQTDVGPLKLTAQEAAREWVWRLGAALVPELVQGGLACDSLPAHSTLRLFVTNDCQISNSAAPAAPSVTGQGDEASELSSELQATSISDAAALDAGSAGAHSWVDQVQVVVKEAGGGNEWEAGRFSFSATFKVCGLQADGMRSASCWSCDVEALAPAEPSPHGFLARSIRVTGPLSAQHTQLRLPGEPA